jgi:hypothetical protein
MLLITSFSSISNSSNPDLLDQNGEPMNFGRSFEALRKSWRSLKLNRKNGSPAPELALRILKLQNGLGLPLSQFEELEKYGGSEWALQELENQESAGDEEEVILRREERDSMLADLGVDGDSDESEWSDWSGSDDLNGEELSKELRREEFQDQLNAWGLKEKSSEFSGLSSQLSVSL